MKLFAARLASAATLALALAFVAAAPCAAAAPAKPDAKADSTPSLLPGASSKEPISIEADKLVYFDKAQKAVYTGNVVVIQGDTKMTCSAMTIFMEKTPDASAPDAAKASDAAKSADAKPADASSGPSAGTSRVKHLDAVGPVTVISKTQVATGDRASYDKAQNKVWLIGNVTMSDGGNVTKGDKLTYDLTTGQATVDVAANAAPGTPPARVKGLFIPGSSTDAGDNDKSKSKK